jgi:hypothetical protein
MAYNVPTALSAVKMQGVGGWCMKDISETHNISDSAKYGR